MLSTLPRKQSLLASRRYGILPRAANWISYASISVYTVEHGITYTTVAARRRPSAVGQVTENLPTSGGEGGFIADGEADLAGEFRRPSSWASPSPEASSISLCPAQVKWMLAGPRRQPRPPWTAPKTNSPRPSGSKLAAAPVRVNIQPTRARPRCRVLRNPATALIQPNDIAISIEGNELRDDPNNRLTNNLFSSTVYVDAQYLTLVPAGTGGYATARDYTPGGLLEVSGWLANVPHTIGEWMAAGGTITLSTGSKGVVVAQPGSIFNIDGGSIQYRGSDLLQSYVLATDGQI
jgi:hypothetical protein